MRCLAHQFDSYGMRALTPFGALLLCGAFCSALVAGRAWLPAGAVRAEEPASLPSADVPANPPFSYRIPTTVTNVTPVPARPQTVAPSPAIDPPAPAVEPPATPSAAVPPGASEPAGDVRPLAAGLAAVSGPAPSEEKSAALLLRMNAARDENGQEPLMRDPELDEIALVRARDLVANGYFDHYGPDGSSAFSELALRGRRYRLAGENLARNNYPGPRTVQAAFDGLMASPGHRANILEEGFGRVGIAAVPAGRLWVYVTVFTD